MSMIFQSYALWPNMTVEQNVAFGLKMRKVAKDEQKRRVGASSTWSSSAQLAARYPNELSGGQQQRVALARALVVQPEILLLDEPLSNLDANLREEMRSEIRRLHNEFGITSIYVTHDQSEAMTTSDRIAVMNKGRIEQIDDPLTLSARPKTRYVAEFIGRSNILDGKPNGTSVAFNGFDVRDQPARCRGPIRTSEFSLRSQNLGPASRTVPRRRWRGTAGLDRRARFPRRDLGLRVPVGGQRPETAHHRRRRSTSSPSARKSGSKSTRRTSSRSRTITRHCINPSKPSRQRRARRIKPQQLPLSRFKVIDLTLARAGPSCVRTLADWGADVIRVEPPPAKANERTGRPPRRLGLPEPASQQARHHAEPEIRRRPRNPAAARRTGRRRRREHAARRHQTARRRFRIRQEAQPAHRLWQHFRLRPERSLCLAAVDRPDRARHVRHHVGDRAFPARARCASASPSPTSWPAHSWRKAS